MKVEHSDEFESGERSDTHRRTGFHPKTQQVVVFTPLPSSLRGSLRPNPL